MEHECFWKYTGEYGCQRAVDKGGHPVPQTDERSNMLGLRFDALIANPVRRNGWSGPQATTGSDRYKLYPRLRRHLEPSQAVAPNMASTVTMTVKRPML